jgi:hypothetical protein
VTTIPVYLRSGAGHYLVTEYDLAERERIRQALLAYMREHKIGTPTLAKRIKASHPRHMEIPLKTLQRVLAGKIRTHDMALSICAAFVDKLPDRPLLFDALGEALHDVYAKEADVIAGAYTVSAHEIVISELTITTRPRPEGAVRKYHLVKEVTTASYRRIYDGVLVFAGRGATMLLKDRLMGGARVHGLHLNKDHFHGFVYDNEPLENGGVPYQNIQTIVHRTGNVSQ